MKDRLEALINNTHVEIKFNDTEKGNLINLYKKNDRHTFYHSLLEKILDIKNYHADNREDLINFIISSLEDDGITLPEVSTDEEILAVIELNYKTFLYTDLISLYGNKI